MKIPCLGVKGSADGGSVKDFVGLLVPYFEDHQMTYMFSNPYPVAQDLRGFGGEMAVIEFDENRFKPLKIHHGREDISDFSCGNKDRLSVVQGKVRGMVQDMHAIH